MLNLHESYAANIGVEFAPPHHAPPHRSTHTHPNMQADSYQLHYGAQPAIGI